MLCDLPLSRDVAVLKAVLSALNTALIGLLCDETVLDTVFTSLASLISDREKLCIVV